MNTSLNQTSHTMNNEIKHVAIKEKKMQNIQKLLNKEIYIGSIKWITETIDEKLVTYDMNYPSSFDANELDKMNIKCFNIHEYLKISAGECIVSDIIRACVYNDIHNPIFILEYRHQTDSQYYFDIYLKEIDCELFLFNEDLYFESELVDLFEIKESPFDIDFKKNSKLHKLRHINVYVLDEELSFLYEQIQNINKMKNALAKVTPKKSIEEVRKFFNLSM
jgi:hypothetical protein